MFCSGFHVVILEELTNSWEEGMMETLLSVDEVFLPGLDPQEEHFQSQAHLPLALLFCSLSRQLLIITLFQCLSTVSYNFESLHCLPVNELQAFVSVAQVFPWPPQSCMGQHSISFCGRLRTASLPQSRFPVPPGS